ncbi:MAG: glycosyltransferase, partial [Planctomycetes bacterium]|nr:glycosyltransferase [Planctomycetota bacterium]
CRAAGLPALFRAPLPTRVLLVSHDVAGERMAGPAIRTLEMARALSDSFEVSVAVPEGSRDPGFGLPLVPYGLRREEELKAAVRRADALVVQGFTLSEHPWVADAGVPLVVDLSCPFTLENYEFFLGHRVDPRDAARAGEAHLGVLKGLLRSGDFFLCATEEQRDFWLGMLHAVGRLDAAQYARDPTARSLIDLVPFGTPEDPPKGPGALKGKREGIGPGDFVLLWGGGIFEWFDPETLLRAVARARKRNPRLKLFFLGTKHPNPAVPEMAVLGRARALARELGLAGSGAFFHEGWVPYAERERYLVDADAGVSVHRDGLETRFSFRTRILDYFWAGLPVVTTEGDFFAGLVRREGAGVAVPEGDPEALAAALEALAADPERRRSLSEASRRLGAAYRWKKVVETLRAFLSSPRRLPPCRGSDPDRGAGGEDPAAIRERMAALEFRYRNVERLLSVLRRIPLARRTWRAFKKRRGWD